MGNGSCCKQRQERVETMNCEPSFIPDLGEPAEMISLSDSSEDLNSNRGREKLSKFSQHQKISQMSTGQLNSQKSLQTEQQFSNFVTFQAPSVQSIISSNPFKKMQDDFKQEMTKAKKHKGKFA